MAVIDLWYLKERGADGKPKPSKRHGRGKRWRVDWIDPNTKKPRSQSFEKKQGPGGADEWDKRVNADISRGKYVDPKAGDVTVAEYAERWRPAQDHDASTAAGVERFFRLHVLPHIGERPMKSIDSLTLKTWIKDRSAEMAASSLGTGWIYVKAMFTTAADDDVIPKNPCTSRVTPPTPERRNYYVAKPAEVHLLAEKLATLRPEWKPVPYIAAGCGARPSEALGLEVGHVDFAARKLHIRQQLKWTKARGVHIAKVKTKLSDRDVDLPDGVASVLAEHLEKLGDVKPVKLWDWTNERKPVERDVYLLFKTPERGPEELNAAGLRLKRHRLHKSGDHTLCLAQNCPDAGAIDAAATARTAYEGGGPIYGGLWSAPWADAVALAGLPIGYGLHDLRHYFATLLIHKGKSVKTVQLALGHANPMITLNTYVHEWPDVEDRTRDIVDAELFQDPKRQGC